jgi:hypothetical protein
MPGLNEPVTDFEIESEAQHDGYFQVSKGQDRLDQYTRLLKTAYRAAHAANPKVRIILTGINMGDIFDDGRSLSDRQIAKIYLQRLIHVPQRLYLVLSYFNFVKNILRLKDYFDVIEFHYNLNYIGGYGQMNWIKNKMAEYGYSKPIWAGDALIATPAEAPPSLYKPFPKLGSRLFDALNSAASPYNKRVWGWYLADQSANLTKKIIVAFDTGMEGVMAANQSDWPQWASIPGQRCWVYGGFYGQDDPKFPVPGSLKGKRPVFYNYRLIIDKIGPRIKNIERLNIAADSNLFVYRITKPDNRYLYVAWYEDPVARAGLRAVRTLDEFLRVVAGA